MAVACSKPVISEGFAYIRLCPLDGSSNLLLPTECSDDTEDSGSNQTWKLENKEIMDIVKKYYN